MSDSDDDDDDEEVEACRIGMELMMHTIGSQIDVFEHASLIFHRNAIACCQFSSHWYGKFSYLSSCRRFTFVWNVWCTANVSCSLFVLLLLLSSLSKHTQTHEFTSFSAFLLFCPWAFDIYKCIYSNLKCHSNWACMPLEHILQLLNIIYFYRRDMSEMVEVVVAVEGLGRAYILFNMTFDKWQCRLQNHQRSIHHFCAIQFFFSGIRFPIYTLCFLHLYTLFSPFTCKCIRVSAANNDVPIRTNSLPFCHILLTFIPLHSPK